MNQYNIKQSSGVLRKILAVTLVGWFLGMSPVCYGNWQQQCMDQKGCPCESTKMCVTSCEYCDDW